MALAAPEELLLQVDVNRQQLNQTVVVLRSDKRLFVAREDLARWRLRVPEAAPLVHQGIEYYPLDALPAATFQLDESRQTLTVAAAPQAFTETRAALRGTTPSDPILPGPGGFLNYAVSIADTEFETRRTGIFEAGVFSRYGVLTSTLLASELESTSSWVRLESTYTIDDPERRTSLRLGDSVTRPGAWGLPVRFGGVQYGTKFATQPGFIPFPLLSALGQAALPSTVDVFVNNALITRRSVPPGPFSVTDIPVVTGGGDMRVVVRDILGREQVFTQPFYGSTALLRRGVADYSFELGALRESFGLRSADYGEALAVGTYRRGLSDELTGELRGEGAESASSAGVSLAARAGLIGVFNASLAASRSEHQTGGLAGAGFEHSAGPFSAALQTVHASRDFRQAGMLEGELARRRQSFANVGVQLGFLGSVSLTHARQDFYDREDLKVSTVAYNVPVPGVGQFGVSAIHSSGASGGDALFATLAIPLGEATSASLGYERTRASAGGSDRAAAASLQRSLPLGDGYGYRLRVRDEDLYGSYALRTRTGTYELEAARPEGGSTATRLTAAGAVGTVGGYAFLSRDITDSFGVVRVADFPEVRVLHDNQVIARTDSQGYAVLPRLRAYDRNPIAVDSRDLPFDASLGALRLHATPYYRSGVFVEFPVRRIRAATLRVVLEDGSDLPSGALARIEGRSEQSPVALRGQAYLEGLERDNRLAFTWRGQRCTIDVSYPPGDDPLPDLGTYVCKGVKP